MKNALVIGGCGGFGQRITSTLREHDVTVATIDRVASADIQLDVVQEPQAIRADKAARVLREGTAERCAQARV